MKLKQRLMGIFILFFLYQMNDFIFDGLRSYEIICTNKAINKAENCLLNSNIFGYRPRSFKLGELKSATVTRGKTYSIILHSNGSQLDMLGYSSAGYDNKQTAVDAINNYIQNGVTQSFKVPYSREWWLIAIFGIFVFAGVSLCLGLANETKSY